MASGTHHSTQTAGPAPSMVGRTAERVLLSEQLSAAQSGHGNVVIVGGEAGIGKTTVARDLIGLARQRGCAILTGHCYDLMAAPPYGLWLDLAERYRHAPKASDLPPLPAMLAGRDLEAITSQSIFFSQVAAFLRDVAARQPTVVLLEDVHWADPVSLELLRHVAARVDDVPLLLVVTYRDDELTRQNPFYRQLPALVRESGGLRLDLRRLGLDDLDALVTLHHALPDDDRGRLVAYLAEHADGNPFFALELLRALEEQGAGGLARLDDGSWVLGGLDRIVVPPLVRQVIDARVERLGEATREPLTVAAVIGHEFAIDLLASITDTPPDALYGVIDRAIEWRLIAPMAGGGVQFVHALTREALYDAIPPHRRRLLHRRVAEALDGRVDADPDVIAYHYQRAGDRRAPHWLVRAGDRAQSAYAWLAARDRFAAAAALLEHTPGEERTRARLLYRCGRLQRYWNADAATDNLRDAARLAEQAGDHLLAADATYSQGLVQCFDDEWTTGLRNMIRGIEALRSLPPSETYIPWTTAGWMADALPTIAIQQATEAYAPGESLVALDAHRHMSLSWFLAQSGRLREALRQAEPYRRIVSDPAIGALGIASAGHSAFGRGMALAALGDPDGARAAFREARESYQRIDHHAVLAFVDITELIDVMVPFRTSDVAGRSRLTEDARMAIERSRGAIPAQVQPDRVDLVAMFLDGRWHDARRLAAESVVHGTYVLRRPVTFALSQIATHQGDHDEAWTQVRSLLPDGPAAEPGSAMLLDALLLQRLAVALCLDAGDVDGAERWLDANERWLAWSETVLGVAEHHIARGEWHRAAGDPAAAQASAERAITAAGHPVQPLALMRARRLRGDLARERGDARVADEELTSSLILASSCQLPFERARTMLALARLRATTSRAEAVTMANEALEIAGTLGARPLVAQIEAFLADIADDPRMFPAGLTAREVDVLRLVAQGMTDAEVGDALSISPRTVSQHLRSVYGKLGVRSRLEAARFGIDHGLV